jgi:hypothetical protein
MVLNFSRENMIFIFKCSLVGIVANIILSFTLGNLRSSKIVPGKKKFFLVKFIDEIILMFRHHKRVLFTSSVIVAIAVFVSVLFAPLYTPLFNKVEFLKVDSN